MRKPDSPIYLRVQGPGPENKCQWYAIKPKEADQEPRHGVAIPITLWLLEDQEVVDDRVVKLAIPDLNISDTTLVSSDTCLYLIGGWNRQESPYIGYHRFRFGGKVEGWKRFGNFVGGSQVGGATLCSSGWVYSSSGNRIHRFRPDEKEGEEEVPLLSGGALCSDGWVYSSSGNRIHRLNPNSFKDEEEGEEVPLLRGRGNCYYSILGCGGNYLYAYTDNSRAGNSNTLLSYDMRKEAWSVLLEDKFWGSWSQGVVLNVVADDGGTNDPYLLSFGNHNPKRQPPFSEQEKQDHRVSLPGVYAFNLRTREWLDQPVAGLDEPVAGFEIVAEESKWWQLESPHPIVSAWLVKVGRHRGQLKLALLWTRSYTREDTSRAIELQWSKFVVKSPASVGGPFVAKLLSRGVCHLEGGLQLLDCTAAIDIS